MFQLLNIIIRIALYIFYMHYLSKIFQKYCKISKTSFIIRLINQVHLISILDNIDKKLENLIDFTFFHNKITCVLDISLLVEI